MKLLNSMKLLSLLCTSLLSINYVKAIDTCIEESGVIVNPYCIHSNGKIVNSDGVDQLTNLEKSGNYFIRRGNNFEIVKDGDKQDVILLNVSVDEGNISYKEETINSGYYIGVTDEGENILVQCNNSNKCNFMDAGEDVKYYIDYKGDLIKAENGELSVDNPTKGYFVNGSSDTKQLIKCDSTCIEVAAQDEDVYLTGNSLIICDAENGKVKCSYKDGEQGYYINSSQLSDSKPLIECEGNTCNEIVAPEPYSYYANNVNATKVISCSSTKASCKLEKGNVGDFYVQINGDDSKLIECVYDEEDGVKCTESANRGSGYYVNAGANSATNQTILCDQSKCTTKHVNPGYFINVGALGEDDDIIQCDLNTCVTKSISEIKCGTITSATVCYDEEKTQFQFYKSEELNNPLNYTNADVYVFDNLKKFPSISNSETTTLYRIGEFSVERYIGSGVVGVSTVNNQKVTDYSDSTIGTDVLLYDCSLTTKLCTKRNSCVANTYMYDIENKTALFCNSGKLEVVSSKGYYIDGVTMVGTKTPYIIICDDSGCSHEAPSITSYYVNSGYDSNTNALIYCSNSSCYTVTASSGHYVSDQQSGIITCTSSTSCTYKDASAAGNNANYVNAGADKGVYALIYCSKKTCVPKAAKNGYYFTNRVTNLISCESTNACSEITPTVNYYYYADTSDSKNYIINCSKVAASIVCSKEIADTGSYLTSKTNILITCTKNGSCKQISAKPGYYQSAVKITINSKRDLSNVENEAEMVNDISGRDATTTYNIIECTTTNCELLTAEELSAIPVCEYSSDKCYITLSYAMSKSAVTSITAGNICTNSDRSKFYFATDTIVVAPSVIAGQTATYVYTTTTTNCLIADSKYSDYYYTVGSDIYHISDGSISHFYESGYYFINVEKNTLVNSNNIDNYNNENVKLYKCNGVSCKILDEPEDATYYADVNKRIIKYNVNSDSYSFAYDKDITCIFSNNKCTPNADLNNREFCITYKGEIALAAADIKNRETGDCYRASSVNNYIFGYNQYLYKMDINSATIVDKNGYYIVSLSSNNTVVTKDYKNRMVNTNSIKIYGCYNSNCKVYDPVSSVYYYDEAAKTMLKNEDDSWKAPAESGYALVSINPNEKYIYRFKIEADEVTLLGKATSGYYYTIDNEMYECSEDDNACKLITNTDYYFTNTGEIFYCVYDSENLEKTECNKQSCYVGQNYYISDNYYRCEAGSYLTPIKSRNCKYDENVVVNFPTILKEEFPASIKQAIENIEKNNNSTAVGVRSNKKYLSVVPAIYTNCTYNVEETEASYDFVCINNFVTVNDEDDTVEICSIENLGYVECVEDESNPEKCTPSGAYSRIVLNFFTIILAAFATFYVLY